ncbi:hypothetical protein CRYUN_Cryun34aG0037600 [Craigia yunnanensis]
MATTRLSGVLSPSIGNLSHLRTMLFLNDQLPGRIPDEIGKLSELQTLDLSGNQFLGEIPSSLGTLTRLSYLYLSFNNFSGPSPKILAKVCSITWNNFLCTSSSEQICTDVSNPLNGSVSSSRVSGYHLSVAIGISSTFVVSVMLLVWWVHWYRSRFLLTSYGTPKFTMSVVAVKRLKDPNFTGEVQFQTEVGMIGLALLRNLLHLYGFCMTPDERLLVYPYMPNGTVADRLRDE